MYPWAVLGTTTIARAQVGGVSSRSARPGILTEPRSFCQFKIDPRTPCNICFVQCFETPTYMPDPDHMCAEHRYHGCEGSMIMMANEKRICASSTGVFSFDPCVVERCRGILGPTEYACPKCGTPDFVREEIRSARAGKSQFRFPIFKTEHPNVGSSPNTNSAVASTLAPPKITLSRVQLVGVDLSGKVLAGMIAVSVNLHKARLHQTDLMGAELTEAILTDADLSEANLSHANLDAANLSGAHMSDVKGHFAFCDLADFSQTNIAWANFYRGSFEEADLRDVWGVGANFESANLSRANFRRASVIGATFIGADLSGADLTAADCRGANFKDASLTGANIYGADLSFTNLTEEQLASTVSIVTD